MLSFSTKEGRETEEKFYTLAIEETEKGIINKALWAKALVESSNEIDKARAIYIKLRVQKYYDETRFEDEQERIQKREQEMNKNKEEKNQKSLETLQVTVSKTLVRFKFITGIIFIFSILGLILAIVTRSASYDYSWWILLFLSISLILISSYLFLGFYAISTITDYKILRNKLNIFFSILIPASAAGMIVGVILPLLALFMFISCIALTIHAIKFNLAYSHARKNNLI